MPDRSPGFLQNTALDVAPGAIERLPAALARLGVRRPALVIDIALVDGDVGQRLKDLLTDHVLVARPSAEPTLASVAAAGAAVKDGGADGIVAVGGGSTLDTGKLARALVATGLADPRELPKSSPPGPPLVTVPSTAGTGAEAGAGSLVYDPAADDKILLRRPGMAANLAICDGDLTLGLPPRITAYTGLDALAQAILAYVPATCDSISGQIALRAIKLIVQHLPVAVRDGRNRVARAGMMLGSVTSALAMFNAPPTFAAEHTFAEPVGSAAGIAHGHAVAAFLVPVAQYNLDALRSPDAEIAREVGVADRGTGEAAAARGFIELLYQLVRRFEVAPLREAARIWNENDLAQRCTRHDGFGLNPRPFDASSVAAILRSAYEGSFRL